MIPYTKEELAEGVQAMSSLIHKCEKAQETIAPGTSQWTTLSKRLNAFRMAYSILKQQFDEKSKE